MSIQKTLPEVFIIESLDLKSEENKAHEGEVLARTLRLSGKEKTKYFYIRTERELDKVLEIFKAIRYRYLHISCHASAKRMVTTFDEITYENLGDKLEDSLDGRRVFVSACQMANDTLASHLLKDTGCFSLLGPANDIYMDDATAFWVAFYHLMFKRNLESMRRKDMRKNVVALSRLLQEPINFFVRDSDAPKGFRKLSTPQEF
jgi:hypothetical protein